MQSVCTGIIKMAKYENHDVRHPSVPRQLTAPISSLVQTTSYMEFAIAFVPPPDEAPRPALGVKSTPSVNPATAAAASIPAAVVLSSNLLPPAMTRGFVSTSVVALPSASPAPPPSSSRPFRGSGPVHQTRSITGVDLVGPEPPEDPLPIVVLANRCERDPSGVHMCGGGKDKGGVLF